jgi:hypothetical protein
MTKSQSFLLVCFVCLRGRADLRRLPVRKDHYGVAPFHRNAEQHLARFLKGRLRKEQADFGFQEGACGA